MKRLNLHIVRNSVSHDSRVLKETATLSESGMLSAVEIAGFHEPGCAPTETIDNREIRRFLLRSRRLPKDIISQSIKFFEWRQQVIGAYRDKPLGVIHCHDLEPLPIGVRLKQLSGAKLVYDAHELETERLGMGNLRKRLAHLTEDRCLSSVDAMITVSPSIRDWYADHFPNQRIELIRNVPVRSEDSIVAHDLRTKFGIDASALLFIYLGGFTEGRGICQLLSAFRRDSVRHHLLLMGDGHLRDEVSAAAAACNRIHVLPSVSPSDVLAYAAGADVGVSLSEDLSLNNRYCLPNKLFESILAGLPVLVSDLPDQAEYVRSHSAGWITSTDVAAIESKINSISPEACNQKSAQMEKLTENLGWHNESSRLIALYSDLLSDL